MGSKPRIFLTHWKTGESKSIPEWARVLNISQQRLRTKYFEYKQGKRKLDSVLYSPNAPYPYNIYPRRNQYEVVYVFRPTYLAGQENIFTGYEAYNPTDLVNPVMTDIVKTIDGQGWLYNCYPFGVFPTKNDLVRAYVKLKKLVGDREDLYYEKAEEIL